MKNRAREKLLIDISNEINRRKKYEGLYKGILNLNFKKDKFKIIHSKYDSRFYYFRYKGFEIKESIKLLDNNYCRMYEDLNTCGYFYNNVSAKIVDFLVFNKL